MHLPTDVSIQHQKTEKAKKIMEKNPHEKNALQSSLSKRMGLGSVNTPRFSCQYGASTEKCIKLHHENTTGKFTLWETRTGQTVQVFQQIHYMKKKNSQ